MIDKFFLKSICILALLPIHLFGVDIELFLSSIPMNEKHSLEQLFSFFVKWDQLGHVLFFENKPVCFAGVPVDCDFCVTPSVITKDPIPFQRDLTRGWEVWKKYESLLLNNQNFIVCEESRTIRDKDKSGLMIDIFFINKRALLKCLCNHIEIFKKELGDDFSPEIFVKKIEQGKKLRPLINRDEMLLGILLGFGCKAASDYKNEIPGKTVGKMVEGCRLSPVSFRGDPELSESKMLIQAYSDELKIISDKYQGKDWLTVTLKALSQEN